MSSQSDAAVRTKSRRLDNDTDVHSDNPATNEGNACPSDDSSDEVLTQRLPDDSSDEVLTQREPDDSSDEGSSPAHRDPLTDEVPDRHPLDDLGDDLGDTSSDESDVDEHLLFQYDNMDPAFFNMPKFKTSRDISAMFEKEGGESRRAVIRARIAAVEAIGKSVIDVKERASGPIALLKAQKAQCNADWKREIADIDKKVRSVEASKKNAIAYLSRLKEYALKIASRSTGC